MMNEDEKEMLMMNRNGDCLIAVQLVSSIVEENMRLTINIFLHESQFSLSLVLLISTVNLALEQ